MKKYYLALPLILSAIWLNNCSGDNNVSYNEPKKYTVNSEELTVYGKVLDLINVKAAGKVIYLMDSTRRVIQTYAVRSYEYFKSFFPELEQETYNSFMINCITSYGIKSIPQTINANISLCTKYLSMTGTENIYGIIQFSRVGFNTKHTQSIVFINDYCGELAMKEYYLILKHENNAWKIKSYIIIGMS